MKISYKHNFIFIHMWKNAGTSVRNALDPYAYQVTFDRKLRYHFCKLLGLNPGEKLARAYEAPSPHLKAVEVRDLLGKAAYDQFYSFSFSRNPYTRLVSQYTKITFKESHGHHQLAKDLGSFEEYVKWRVNSGKETFQWQFVNDLEGNTIVDFIGKFETLPQDLKHVGEHLGLELNLSHHNKTIRAEKSTAEYFTPSLVEFVKTHYEKDFEFFGYDINRIP